MGKQAPWDARLIGWMQRSAAHKAPEVAMKDRYSRIAAAATVSVYCGATGLLFAAGASLGDVAFIGTVLGLLLGGVRDPLAARLRRRQA